MALYYFQEILVQILNKVKGKISLMLINNRSECCKYFGCLCVCGHTGDAANIGTILGRRMKRLAVIP